MIQHLNEIKPSSARAKLSALSAKRSADRRAAYQAYASTAAHNSMRRALEQQTASTRMVLSQKA